MNGPVALMPPRRVDEGLRRDVCLSHHEQLRHLFIAGVGQQGVGVRARVCPGVGEVDSTLLLRQFDVWDGLLVSSCRISQSVGSRRLPHTGLTGDGQ